LKDNKCLTTIPDGFYGLDRVLYACDPSCLTCSAAGPAKCTSCIAEKALDNNKCVSKCPSNKFEKDNECQPCDTSCNTCSGASAKDCLSCKGDLNYWAHVCYKTCPTVTGVSFVALENECKLCNAKCKTCNGLGSNKCTSCDRTFLNNNKCLFECPAGKYAD